MKGRTEEVIEATQWFIIAYSDYKAYGYKVADMHYEVIEEGSVNLNYRIICDKASIIYIDGQRMIKQDIEAIYIAVIKSFSDEKKDHSFFSNTRKLLKFKRRN